MPALLALIPTKDWVYLGLIIALLSGFGIYTIHERHIGAANEIAKVQEQSTKVLNAAADTITKLNTQHAATVAATQETYEKQHAADLTQHDSDARRLREYDTYRHSRAALGGPASGQGTAGAGTGVDRSDEDSLHSLEQVALQLATAGREVNANLLSCMTDRDSLTGK